MSIKLASIQTVSNHCRNGGVPLGIFTACAAGLTSAANPGQEPIFTNATKSPGAEHSGGLSRGGVEDHASASRPGAAHSQYHPSDQRERDQSRVAIYFAKTPMKVVDTTIPEIQHGLQIPLGHPSYSATSIWCCLRLQLWASPRTPVAWDGK